MNKDLKKIDSKIKLTEKDKRILRLNGDICTDFHGNGCNVQILNIALKELN